MYRCQPAWTLCAYGNTAPATPPAGAARRRLGILLPLPRAPWYIDVAALARIPRSGPWRRRARRVRDRREKMVQQSLKQRSREVTEGVERAPHRAFLRAMGLDDEDLSRPFVGVASSWNEATPCNLALDRQADAAKRGVSEAGGTPREFVTIAVSDGIAMGHEGMKASLISREVIADSVELMIRAHCYDAFVGLAGCDKSLPGMLMVMARLNLPSIFLYGGTIMPGRFQGRAVTIQDVYEGVGAVEAGRMTEAELHELECGACPGAGSCGGQFTANTMACVAEAIGMALPGSSSPPAVETARDKYAEECGRTVMRLLEQDLRPRQILTREAF